MKPAVVFKALLSFFILVIGGFALYEYQNSQMKKVQKETSFQLLPNIKLKDIKLIRLVKKTSVTQAVSNMEGQEAKLLIVKRGKDWYLLKPLDDLASFTELSRWFNTLSRHKVTALEAESMDLNDYHLNDNTKVELELNTGQKIDFSISSKSFFDGRWFIKKGDQVFLAEKGIDKELQGKNLEDFRSKKILPNLEHADKIEFHQGASSFTLNWQNHKWFLEGREESELPLDQNLLNDFWNKLVALKASSLPGAKRELKKYKLDKPALKLNLFYGDKEYLLKISSPQKGSSQEDEHDKHRYHTASPQEEEQQKNKLYASISHRNYIFETPNEDSLFISKEKLYNHNFPFSFKSELVSQIEIKTQTDSFIHLEKKKEKWKIKGDRKQKQSNQQEQKNQTENQTENQTDPSLKKSSKKEDLKGDKKEQEEEKNSQAPDSDKIQDFLNQFKTLIGTYYEKAKEEQASLRSLTLKDADAGLIFELKEMKQSKTQSWLKSNLWSEWIVLPKETADKFFKPSLLKENTKKNTK